MKKKTKTIFSTAFAVVLAGGLIANFVFDAKAKDTKTIGVTSYQIAAFNPTTSKVDKEDDGHILSDYFLCEGLTIKTSEDFNIEYKILWFNEDKEYVSASSVLMDDWSGDIPSTAEYARIEIDPVKDEDGTVSIFELPGYVAQLEVTVNK